MQNPHVPQTNQYNMKTNKWAKSHQLCQEIVCKYERFSNSWQLFSNPNKNGVGKFFAMVNWIR
jgi:hypothetical protein